MNFSKELLRRKKRLFLQMISYIALVALGVSVFSKVLYIRRVDSNLSNPFLAEFTPAPTPVPEPMPGDPSFILNSETIFMLDSLDLYRKYMYTVDETAYAYYSDFDANTLSKFNLSTDLYVDEPKVLVFHTHGSEAFIDSEEEGMSILEVGDYLCEIFENMGISTIHDRTLYDVVDEKVTLGYSYERMEVGVSQILEENPSIEVMIDLHRDGVGENVRLVSEIDGKDVARLMFFNGIIRLNEGGEPSLPEGLENPFVTQNLALSQRMQLYGIENYPGLLRNIYIRPYRYSLHVREKSMLVECGANTNTFQEALNAMPYLAEIITNTLR